jgi:hypothetical protein
MAVRVWTWIGPFSLVGNAVEVGWCSVSSIVGGLANLSSDGGAIWM